MNKEEIIMDWLLKEVGLKKWNDKAVWFAGLPVAVKEFEKFYDTADLGNYYAKYLVTHGQMLSYKYNTSEVKNEN